MAFSKLTYLRILRSASLTHAQYRVLVTLLVYTNPDGTNAHPGYARLVRECQMSKGTVSKSLKALKKAGWLWETSKGTATKGSDEASVFELRVPEYLEEKRPEKQDDPWGPAPG